MSNIKIPDSIQAAYRDVYTSEVISVLNALSHFNSDIKTAMSARLQRRSDRYTYLKPITFLDPESFITGTSIKVQDARDGKFESASIPLDLQRQWIQGTGPAAKPRAGIESSIRNVAYALLSRCV